ncbi:DUF692 domain-containing protein [Psychrosphaera haliotis]|uniref:DUF692 family protein n=1 Tax=Psychrosphaera haliotis TaxID=555083 RepID=A0A6N8F7Y8_9GAMM|nr:DUF692 domain-containing protein [Psychrosphaera haliotis]MUH71529.1 DUF692 family protein [Psychrosphaera haliotis]
MISGVGLGYRREMVDLKDEILASNVDYIEVAPENWMRMNERYQAPLKELVQHIPLSTHGLSLSLGSPDKLDVEFVKQVKRFLTDFNVSCYSEHLSYCSSGGHVYDLMPIPFTEEAVFHVANRIKKVQDILEQRIAIENVSYYLQTMNDLTEVEFTKAVLEEAQCDLLLDVNNVYVNSINHNYNAKEFISAMPTERIAYGHIAGHYDEAKDLKVDTHGSPVIDDVWGLLDFAYQKHGVFPTLLERDFNIPDMSELNVEIDKIHSFQKSDIKKKQKG